MSGTFPTLAGFKTLNWQSNHNTLLTETISNKVFTRDLGGQYWSFTVASPPLTRADFGPIWSFIVQQKGGAESFYIAPPIISDTAGTFADDSTGGNLVVASSASIGAGTVTVTPTGSGTLIAGDLIKFSNHDKVYMLKESVTLTNSVNANLSIFPNLIQAQGVSQTVITQNVEVKVILNNSIQTFNTNTTGYYSYEIDVREVL